MYQDRGFSHPAREFMWVQALALSRPATRAVIPFAYIWHC